MLWLSCSIRNQRTSRNVILSIKDNTDLGGWEVSMFTFIEEILLCFRSCFTRKAAFEWAVTVIIGLMVRSDTLGVTSVIRDLALDPALYDSMIHFFRADSWKWDDVFASWVRTVSRYAPLKRISGRAVLVGDGIKRACDGRYMPCVKKMAQESEDSSKPMFIHGHLWGAIGVLIGNATKVFCLPLSIQIHDGDGVISDWLGDESVSHVVQTLRDGFRAAQLIGKSLFVLDRYFLTRPMLLEWRAHSAEGPGLLHVVTRAKKNCIAYKEPGPYKGRGRRPVHGDAVRLRDLFVTQSESFQNARLQIYGAEREARFLSRTYLWGKGLYQALQFVLVECGQTQSILACTDLSMPAEDIITAYAYRFKIEAMFREMKQQIGGLAYHFWTNAVPRLDRYRRKGADDPLLQVNDRHNRQRIIKTLKATEGYVMFSGIAIGVIQMLCLKCDGKIRVSRFRYLRTPSRQVMSEASMMEYLKQNLFRFMAQQSESTITKIISNKQVSLEKEGIDRLIS